MDETTFVCLWCGWDNGRPRKTCWNCECPLDIRRVTGASTTESEA